MVRYKEFLNSVKNGIVVFFLPFLIILLYVLAFISSVSKSAGIPDIFVFKLADSKAQVELRVGYFGMCVSDSPDRFTCATTFMADPTKAFPAAAPAVKGLLAFAQSIQSKALVFAPLLVGALLYSSSALAVVMVRWRVRSAVSGGNRRGSFGPQRAGTRVLRSAALLLAVYALGATVAAAMGTTMGLGALALSDAGKTVGDGVVLTPGITLQALQWFAVVLMMVSHFGVTMLYGNGDVGGTGLKRKRSSSWYGGPPEFGSY